MRVFISSTYKDLIEYRAAAIRAVEGTNYQASKMEVFGARPDEPLDACLKEVEESDFFVGIYALRYGFIPVGKEISITEMEYVHAKQLGKTIYCFLLDEDNQPWLKKWIEDEPGKSKLEDFKQRIQKLHVCDYFTTPDDLRAKVSNALSHFVANYAEHNPHIPVYKPLKPTGNTLPAQPYFFGRENELTVIADAISPESRTWGALIDGPGGIGKTALAIRAAHLAPSILFNRKIFITSKVRELTSSGEKSLEDFTRPNYLALLNELALELGDEQIPHLAPDERANALRMTLAKKKTLIIFDNLETLQEDERIRLFQFLSRLPEGNKAIVTSRRRADVDARVVRLDRLEAKEALALIAELAKTNQRLRRENPDEWQKLYAITNGNPLLIKWTCGQLGREGSQMHTIADACDFIEKAPESNDPLEYIFGDLIDNFSVEEKSILSVLVHFSIPVGSGTLAKITRMPQSMVQTSMEDLIDRAILVGDSQSKLCYLPPLTAKFLRRASPEFDSQSSGIIRDMAFRFISDVEDDPSSRVFRLEAEWPLISAALPLLVNGKYRNLQQACRLLGSFLEFSGHWTEWLKLSLQAEIIAKGIGDFDNAGWRAYDAAWANYLLQEPEHVLACASRAETHWNTANKGYLEKAIVLRLKGMAHQLKADYQLAIEAFYNALNLQIRISPSSKDVAISLNDLAEAERRAGNYQGAERDLKSALKLAQILLDREGTAIYMCNLAELALDQNAWQDAEKHARAALPITEQVGRQELVAINYMRLARSLVPQNRPSEALLYIRKAIEIFTRLHSKELWGAQQLLSKIENLTIQK